MDVLVQALSFAITFVAGPVPSVLSAINAASSALNRGGRLLRVFAKILRAIARVIQQIDDVIEGLAGKVSDAIRGSLRGSSKKLSRTVDRLSKKIDAGDADIDDVVRDTVDIGDELSDVVIALCLGVRPRGHACFPAGTLVTTSQGLLPIEQIQRGMHVLGRDAVTGEWGYGEVEIAFERSYSGDLVSLQIGGEKIDCTPGHSFWVSAGEGL